MAGSIFTLVPDIIDGTTLCLSCLLSQYCSITLFNPFTI